MIPIGAEIRLRHPPYANWLLIGLNVAVFLLTDVVAGPYGNLIKQYGSLDAARPLAFQYVSYQFLHGDWMHLAGNMLFLWIFGGPVCDRMGSIAYLLFYVAGGIFAAVTFAANAENPMVGASGAIAAVTTAFLALFPRIQIRILALFIFIVTFHVPAMILIVFKIILWDNILAPSFNQGAASHVAYSAHLGGYLFGFFTTSILMLVGALPRHQFDLWSIWDRWRRRQGLGGGPTRVLAGVPGRGVPARPVRVQEVDSRPLEAVPLTPVEELREEIGNKLAERDLEGAAAAYLRLIEMDNQQVLARTQQLEIANHLAQMRQYPEAAHAYETFLAAYPGSADRSQVRLFLGLIYSRYLGQYEQAVRHLRQALEELQLDAQRTLASVELKEAESRLGQAAEPEQK